MVAPVRLAHRGDWRVAPENTLAAMAAALANPGCDGLEFDVRLTRDRVPVLLHDSTLDRVQGRPGAIAELTTAEAEAAGIPTLAAVLALVAERRPDAFLDVELKGDDHGAETAAVLRAAYGDAPTTAIVSSFEPPTLASMGRVLPGWGRWLNTEDLAPATLAEATRLGCRAVSVEVEAIDAASMAEAAAAGLELAAWTITDPAVTARLAALGVVGVCVEGAALDAPRSDP